MLDRIKRIRIIMIAIMIVIGFLINHITMLQNGLWIVIVILLINAPMSGGLVVFQAKQVFWGALAGVIFAIPIWIILHFNYNLLFIFALIFISLASFLIQKNIIYYQAIVVSLLIMLFDYSDPAIFDVKLAALDRIICVIIAVSMFFIFEHILNALFIRQINSALYEECSKIEFKTAAIIDKLLLQIKQSKTINTISSSNFYYQLHNNYAILLLYKQDLQNRIGAIESVRSHIIEAIELTKDAMLQLQILSNSTLSSDVVCQAAFDKLQQVRSNLDEHRAKGEMAKQNAYNRLLANPSFLDSVSSTK